MKGRKEKTKCKCKSSGSEFTEISIHRRDIHNKNVGSKLWFCLDSSKSFVKHMPQILYIFTQISRRYIHVEMERWRGSDHK